MNDLLSDVDNSPEARIKKAINEYNEKYVIEPGTTVMHKTYIARHHNSDRFKYLHHYNAGILDRDQYALDIDFCFVTSKPYGALAVLDHKQDKEKFSWTGIIFYNHMIRMNLDVFIVTSRASDNFIKVDKYLGGDPAAFPAEPTVKTRNVLHFVDMIKFGEWQKSYRAKKRMSMTDEYTKKQHAGNYLLKIGRETKNSILIDQGESLINDAYLLKNGYGSCLYIE